MADVERSQVPLYDEAWAAAYEQRAEAAIAGREGLLRITGACLGGLPGEARVLVVGCGTGSELLALASAHPGWSFEAVEPADAMRAACERRIDAARIGDRVRLHARTLEGLRVEPCDGATALLVSQHVVDDMLAVAFFCDIALNLRPGAPMVSADLCAPADAASRSGLLDVWHAQAEASGIPGTDLTAMRERFDRDLRLRSPEVIEALLADAGFVATIPVFQSTLYRAWCSRNTP